MPPSIIMPPAMPPPQSLQPPMAAPWQPLSHAAACPQTRGGGAAGAWAPGGTKPGGRWPKHFSYFQTSSAIYRSFNVLQPIELAAVTSTTPIATLLIHPLVRIARSPRQARPSQPRIARRTSGRFRRKPRNTTPWSARGNRVRAAKKSQAADRHESDAIVPPAVAAGKRLEGEAFPAAGWRTGRPAGQPLRWRMRARIRRFFWPSLRRPLPVFFTPMKWLQTGGRHSSRPPWGKVVRWGASDFKRTRPRPAA